MYFEEDEFEFIVFDRKKVKNKELIPGYQYIQMSIYSERIPHKRQLLIEAALEDGNGYATGCETLVKTINYTDRYKSFEEIEEFIRTNLDIFYSLAEEGDSGFRKIEELLNQKYSDSNDNINDDNDDWLEEEYDNEETLIVTSLDVERADGRNHLLIEREIFEHKEIIKGMRIRPFNDMREDGEDYEEIFEFEVRRVKELRINLKDIIFRNLEKIKNIVNENNNRDIHHKVEQLIFSEI
ncbi:MAG: hypothetical protein Kow0076_0910 [Francisella sp.]